MIKSIIFATIASIILASGTFLLFGDLSNTQHRQIPGHQHTLFSKWMLKYGKTYHSPSEYLYRLSIFHSNHKVIKNLRKSNPKTKYSLNYLADLGDEEFKNTYSNFKSDSEYQKYDSSNTLSKSQLKIWLINKYGIKIGEKIYNKKLRDLIYQKKRQNRRKIMERKIQKKSKKLLFLNKKFEISRKKNLLRSEIENLIHRISFSSPQKNLENTISQNFSSKYNLSRRDTEILKKEEKSIEELSNRIQEKLKGRSKIPHPPHKYLKRIKLNKSSDKIPSQYEVPFQRKVGTQGSCSSCWAWASKHVIQDKLAGVVEISVQHLISCGFRGSCKGGWPDWALNTVANHGFQLESKHPYQDKDVECSNRNGIREPLINQYGKRMETSIVWSQRPSHLKKVLLQEGSLTINIRSQGLRFVRGGVVQTKHSSHCNREGNHIVTLYGYFKDEYWMIRNSWGEKWGENGFGKIEMLKNKDDQDSKCICGTYKGKIPCPAFLLS